MNVFRHHHVSHQRELVTLPHFIEDLQEDIPPLRTTQQGTSPVTTARDEMQMPLPITALQSILQHRHSTPAPFAYPAKSAAPAKEGSKAQTTANHFSVNYRSGIIPNSPNEEKLLRVGEPQPPAGGAPFRAAPEFA